MDRSLSFVDKCYAVRDNFKLNPFSNLVWKICNVPFPEDSFFNKNQEVIASLVVDFKVQRGLGGFP